MKRTGLLICLLALNACTQTAHKPQKETDSPFPTDPGALPASAVTTPVNAAGPVGKVYNVQTEKELMAIDNGAGDGETIFTNPDNPNENIAAITAAFTKKGSMNTWVGKYKKALDYSHREGLPVVLWFHDSFLNPASIKLAKELLETDEFDDWAKDRVVRLRLDTGIRTRNPDERGQGVSPEFVAGIAAQFSVRSKPSVIIMSANGTVHGTLTGYTAGTSEAFFADIKRHVKEAKKDFEQFKKDLEAKGYRTWRGAKDDTSLFAKLQKYDDDQKTVWLKEFDGRITSTRTQLLSQEDLDWIRQQKEEYDKNAAQPQSRQPSAR